MPEIPCLELYCGVMEVALTGGSTIRKKRKYRVNAHCHKVVLNAERTMCLSSGVVKLVFFTLFAILPNYKKFNNNNKTPKHGENPHQNEWFLREYTEKIRAVDQQCR
jgi:hypothetical protein